MSVPDWYFAGLFDESFWAQTGNKPIAGKGAAEVLRQLVAEVGEADLTWVAGAKDLDTLCLCGASFEIKRVGERVQWALSPFSEAPKATGFAHTIGDAIEALVRSARSNYSTKIPAQRH
ncbi:MAG TPA: hypothetical protein VG328_25850 [Stellaceae bacterium]|jgi:hypothetical protein|nr:hypothetical protein [Stellaceae bacterium]